VQKKKEKQLFDFLNRFSPAGAFESASIACLQALAKKRWSSEDEKPRRLLNMEQALDSGDLQKFWFNDSLLRSSIKEKRIQELLPDAKTGSKIRAAGRRAAQEKNAAFLELRQFYRRAAEEIQGRSKHRLNNSDLARRIANQVYKCRNGDGETVFHEIAAKLYDSNTEFNINTVRRIISLPKSSRRK